MTDRFDEIEQLRAEASGHIVSSSSDKKLIVAGPGTGKTFTFRQALLGCEGRGLALTFIRNLVRDLRKDLEDVADVFTFHGFCKHQMHRNPVAGLQKDWHYYPPLPKLIVHDLGLVGRQTTDREIDRALHTLDDSDGVISDSLRLGNYYNAVSHTDLVYRVLRHFEERHGEVPDYPLMVVDEYQDFSLLETSFLKLLSDKSPVLIAGDDDQALYAFKNAEARFIRELAEDDDYELFDLPYCSRCTDVVVSAVNNVLSAAIKIGHLKGRLDKPFACFVPDKHKDSEAHPKLIHIARGRPSNPGPSVVSPTRLVAGSSPGGATRTAGVRSALVGPGESSDRRLAKRLSSARGAGGADTSPSLSAQPVWRRYAACGACASFAVSSARAEWA
jgi:superfamily I DNA/RNA helicase